MGVSGNALGQHPEVEVQTHSQKQACPWGGLWLTFEHHLRIASSLCTFWNDGFRGGYGGAVGLPDQDSDAQGLGAAGHKFQGSGGGPKVALPKPWQGLVNQGC